MSEEMMVVEREEQVEPVVTVEEIRGMVYTVRGKQVICVTGTVPVTHGK